METIIQPAYITQEPHIVRVLDLVDEGRMTYNEALCTVSADPDTPTLDFLDRLCRLWCALAGVKHPDDAGFVAECDR